MAKSPNWYTWEDAILCNLWGKVAPADIPLHHRSLSGIRHRAAALQLDAGRYWTEKEVEFLRRAYGVLSVAGIAMRLRKPKDVVYCKASYLGITTVGGAINVKGIYVPEDIINRYVAGDSVEALSRETGVSTYVLRRALRRKGVKTRTASDECRKRLGKMNEINKQRRNSDPDWRKRISAKLQGIDLRDWQGFTQQGRDRLTLSPAWKKWRKLVYARDQHRCVLCKAGAHTLHQIGSWLEPHHIHMRRHHPELTFDVDNGVTLCRQCHKKIRTREKAHEAWFMGYVIKTKRRGYPVYP